MAVTFLELNQSVGRTYAEGVTASLRDASEETGIDFPLSARIVLPASVTSQ
jgi:hypothetical protein